MAIVTSSNHIVAYGYRYLKVSSTASKHLANSMGLVCDRTPMIQRVKQIQTMAVEENIGPGVRS